MIIRYTLLWIPLVFIAILNGAIRDVAYKNLLGDFLSHQVSILPGIILFGIYIWFITLRWRLENSRQAVIIGLIWLGLTVAFEFLFFHFAMGHSWQVLIEQYDVSKGNMWVFLLLFVAAAPYIAFRLHRR